MNYETRKIIRLVEFKVIYTNTVKRFTIYIIFILNTCFVSMCYSFISIFILSFSQFWQAGGGFIHSNMVFLSRVGFHSAWSLDHKLGICTFPHTRFQSLGPLSRLLEDSEPAAPFSFQGFLHTCTLGGGLICKVLCNQEPTNVLHALIQVKVEIPKLYTFRFCLTYNSFIGDFNTLREHQKIRPFFEVDKQYLFNFTIYGIFVCNHELSVVVNVVISITELLTI